MKKTIYKITKPGTMEAYVGSTKQTLKERLRLHFKEQKAYPNRPVYLWLDETCEIELIEVREVPGTEKDTRKDFEKIEQRWMLNLRWAGYTIMNYKDGKTLVEGYTKAKNTKHRAKNKASGYTKAINDKHNAKKHPEYNNWQNKISKAAKKLGLTSKEYRLKHSIPEYTGPKII